MNSFITLTMLPALMIALLVACNSIPAQEPDTPPPPVTLVAQSLSIEREPDVPTLPFPDNPDPAQCGIPAPWTSKAPAWLTGIYEGNLIQPIVFLYDSHLRRKIVAQAPHGTEVQILLAQSNPQLNYYLVKIIGAELPNEGWIPAPFVSFEKPPPAS